MNSVNGNKILMSLVALTLFASGCATGGLKYVNTERLEVINRETDEGAEVVAEKKEEQAEINVIEQSTNVKTVTKITSHDIKDKDKVTIGYFNLSPDGERIVMSLLKESDSSGFMSQLWGIGKNGGAVTKVTNGKYKDLTPSYSHNGENIYFVSNRGDRGLKIWRIKSSGLGGLTKVTSGSTIDTFPSVSPDDERLVYTSLMQGDDRIQIWSCTVSGTLPTQMTIGETPSYSPDGKKILFIKRNEDTNNNDIWYMDSEGANQTQLTQGDSDESFPSWSADGKFILYSSNAGLDQNGRNNYDIYIMNVDGSDKTQLTTNGSVDINPKMDPDNKYIYFTSNRGGAWNVWRMELAMDL